MQCCWDVCHYGQCMYNWIVTYTSMWPLLLPPSHLRAPSGRSQGWPCCTCCRGREALGGPRTAPQDGRGWCRRWTGSRWERALPAWLGDHGRGTESWAAEVGERSRTAGPGGRAGAGQWGVGAHREAPLPGGGGEGLGGERWEERGTHNCTRTCTFTCTILPRCYVLHAVTSCTLLRPPPPCFWANFLYRVILPPLHAPPPIEPVCGLQFMHMLSKCTLVESVVLECTRVRVSGACVEVSCTRVSRASV